MRRLASVLLAALAFPFLLAAVAAADQAAQLRPIDLRVSGGEESWHAENAFRLDWDSPPVSEDFPVSAVDYRLRDATGAVVVAEIRLPLERTQIENLRVPSGPGIYTADVALEGPGGQRGPWVSAALRFDDRRPGAAQPLSPAGWFAGNAAAVVTIEHPAGPQPISGLRGYAVSVDRGPGSAPCAGHDRCSPEETDLRGGIGDDTVSLGVLSEGVNVVRAVAVSNSGMRSAETRSAIVRVDATRPEVALRGASPYWADGPIQLTASATDSMSGMAASGPSGAYTAIAVDGGVPKAAAGGSVAAIVTGEGLHRVAFYARDAAGNVDEESPPVATVRIDESPPRVAFADFQDPSQPERIEAAVTDTLSGADPARGSIAVRPAGSRQPFLALPTAVSGGRMTAQWDSEAFAPGTYEFRATGYDAAGNAASSERRGNGSRLVLVNPPKTPTEVTAGFGGRRLVWQRCSRDDGRRRCRRETIESFARRPTTRVVPYGRGIPFSGRLASTSGTPLGGLPVRLVETFDAGADLLQRTAAVRTAADGTFLIRLAPGPSRRVEVEFAGSRTLAGASSAAVHLNVLGDVRMSASSASARIGGPPVVFSGRVGNLGAPIPAAGRAIELQFRVPGGEWSEFRTVQTDARGRFRYAYAFSDDDSRGVHFQFRAYAPEQNGWPYEPAASRPVFVTGR